MTQAKVNPNPHGMHTVTPHLVCAGAADAIEFYKKSIQCHRGDATSGPGR